MPCASTADNLQLYANCILTAQCAAVIFFLEFIIIEEKAMTFRQRMEEAINKGLKTSLDVLEKAKDKTMELGERGAKKFEIMKLEHRVEKQFAKLGACVYEMFTEKKQDTVAKDNEEIVQIISEISNLEHQIDAAEEAIKKLKPDA